MDKLKIDNNFAFTEASLELYFFLHIAPKIDSSFTNKKQTPLIKDPGYTRFSEDNISSAMAGIKATKERETLDEVINNIKKEVSSNLNIQNDLKEIAKDFRFFVIKQIGVERYDKASNLIKEDLALNYIKRRVSEMTLDKFIENLSPKTSGEYIIRHLNEESLFSFFSELTGQKNQTQLEKLLEDKAIKSFHPSEKEKAIAALSVTLFDALSLSPESLTGAASSAIGDCAFNLTKEIKSKLSKEEENLTPDEYLSLVVFNSKEDVFKKIRAEAYKEAPTMDFSLLSSRLQNKLSFRGFKPLEFKEKKEDFFNLDKLELDSKKQTSSSKDIPAIVSLEKEEEYLKEKKEEEKQILNFLSFNQEKEFKDEHGAIIKLIKIENDKVKYSYKTKDETQEKELSLFNAYSNIKNKVWIEQSSTFSIMQDYKKSDNSFLNPQKDSIQYSSWGTLLDSLGFNGTESTIHNLPYVLSTLPDELIGLFTGKSNALKLKKDILPLSLMAIGIFIKNPILKMLLLVGGGLNLFNKVGKESINERDSKYKKDSSQFIKEYKDEKLSLRLKEPTIRGNKFTVILDGVPRFALLPKNVEMSYTEGKLPLNTLANALLKEFDKKVSLGYKDMDAILPNENITIKEKENISLSR